MRRCVRRYICCIIANAAVSQRDIVTQQIYFPEGLQSVQVCPQICVLQYYWCCNPSGEYCDAMNVFWVSARCADLFTDM